MNLPTFPADKLGHYLWGSLASVVGVFAARLFDLPVWAGALGAALVVGLIKDVLLDLVMKRGQFDPIDILATAAGGAPAALAAVV